MGDQISQNGCSLSRANRSPHCNGHTSSRLQAIPPSCMTVHNPSLLLYLLQWADVAGCMWHWFAVVTCLGWAHDLLSAENGASLPWSKWKPYGEKTHPWVTRARAGTLRKRAAEAMMCIVAETITQRVSGITKCSPAETVTCRAAKPSHAPLPLPTQPVPLAEEFSQTGCNCGKNKGSWGWEGGRMEFRVSVCLAVCVLLSLDILIRDQMLVWPGNKVTQVKFPDSGLFCPWQLHTKLV